MITLSRSELRRLFPKVERRLAELARTVDMALPSGFGFVLIATSFGATGYSSYVANIDREDTVALLREMADTLERGGDSPPGVLGQAQ